MGPTHALLADAINGSSVRHLGPTRRKKISIGLGREESQRLASQTPPKSQLWAGRTQKGPISSLLTSPYIGPFFQAHLEKPGIRPSTVLNQIYHPDSPERSPRGIQPINLIRPYVAQPVRHLAHLNYV